MRKKKKSPGIQDFFLRTPHNNMNPRNIIPNTRAIIPLSFFINAPPQNRGSYSRV